VSEKPEALEVADSLEFCPQPYAYLVVEEARIRAAARLLREQHAEIERLKAVAFQAQNAAIDLAKKIPRLTADDAAQVIGIMNERSVRMTECRDPSEACLYPRCMVEGRCNLLMSGLCSGPRAADPQQVPR
jgi:hypothetical protein